jgi:alcohol dehydrogenase
MKALVFHGPGNRAWEEKPRPTLENSTDAIIAMTQTVICESDRHIVDGETSEVADGVTLGHEGIGIVVEIGSDVSSFRVGQKVFISGTSVCGTCKECRTGQFSQCSRGGWTLGRLIDGTIADYARIPSADTSLQRIPEGVDEGTLLMLKDIMPIRFEYSVPNGQIQPDDTVVIFGSGQLGLTALLMAQFHSPSDITMVDTNPRCLEVAKALGATQLVHATDGNAFDHIDRLSNGKMIDVAIVANTNVALKSIWRSYGQPISLLKCVLLMPSRC